MKSFKKNKSTARNVRLSSDSQRPRRVFSYYANRSSNPVPTGRQRLAETISSSLLGGLKGLKGRQLPSLVAAAAVLISVLYVLSLSTVPRIVLLQFAQSGALLRSPAVYQQAASDLLTHSLLNQTKLTIDTGSVADGMKQEFPELQTVSVILPLVGRRPVVQLAAVTPSLILIGQNGSFVLDANGRAIMRTDQAATLKQLNLPSVTDQSQILITPGKITLSSQAITFITTIVAQLGAQHLPIDSLVLPPTVNEVDLRLTGQGYTVKLNTQTDPLVAIGTYLAVKQKLEADRTTPSAYVDVRVPGKAFYK